MTLNTDTEDRRVISLKIQNGQNNEENYKWAYIFLMILKRKYLIPNAQFLLKNILNIKLHLKFLNNYLLLPIFKFKS